MNQRGGAVMSHLTISAESTMSPLIPGGRAHMVVALEPIEAIRVLADYGNPEVNVLCNTRPVHPVGVISGELDYPALEDIREWVTELSAKAWFIPATDEAIKLGKPVLANSILIGALSGLHVLPLDRETFRGVMSETMTADKVEENLHAFDVGKGAV
jgi:indolepyruvate ferredoxin oxidoreductase beta subunit